MRAPQSRGGAFYLEDIPLTLSVPVTPKTTANGLVAKQSQIATLAAVASTAPHASQSAQLLLQTKVEFVSALLEHGAIAGGASAILSTVAYTKGGPATAILAQITSLKAAIATNAAGNPLLPNNLQLATNQATTLEQLNRQAVVELLNSGQMSPDAVLAAFSYTGPN
jgi:hypothetical protein